MKLTNVLCIEQGKEIRRNNEEQINKVIDYIEEHLQDENLTLTTIAQEIGYLKYHLYRMFTMIAGITIYQ